MSDETVPDADAQFVAGLRFLSLASRFTHMQINDYGQLGGLWKDVWGNSVFDPFKFLTPIITDMPLEDPLSQAGGIMHQAIQVTQEAGITHAPPRTTPGYGTTTMVAPNAGNVPQMQIEGAQIYGRALVT
ncbi:MAG TPA: hypothetical protein DCQ64_31535, partial [Candidatus Rokubacteria bacterium]|nr:hypothetical protein [Candidatus Rokubacteria bacterium]